ncbi:MAG TPA: acyltransferase [Flavisolibacter sp.]|jgi:peptidoglycan/LPS O-acetylase OafA/YrhL|nr:acyltransferase [Flavisolibacter sp.]
MKKITVLDGLRGIAVLLVLHAHLPQIGSNRLAYYIKDSARFLYSGYIGVDIFFVLSGFLITRILIKDKKADDLSFKRFYLKRSLRIFPIYYLSIFLFGLFVSWKDLAPVAFYYSNYFFAVNLEPHAFRHTWSLSVEEHFYLIWPFIIYFFSLPQAKKIVLYLFPAISIASACFVTFTMSNEEAANFIYRGTNFRILSLAAGSYLAFIEKRLPTKTTTLFIVAATLMIALAVYERYPNGLIPVYLLQLPLFAGVSILIFLAIFSLESKTGLLRNIFTNPILTYIGSISYGIYLYHFPILYLMGITDKDVVAPVSITKGLLALFLCFFIPTISFYAIEKPILKYKDRIGKKRHAVLALTKA